MSSPESTPSRRLRRVVALAFLTALPLTASCTVQPLYAERSTVAGEMTGVRADLSSIAIKPVRQRYAQEVRNHLIFLFNRGGGQSVASAYTLELNVSSRKEFAALVQISDDNEPSAGTMTLLADYKLTENSTGEQISKGKREIAASFDIPRQEFAAVRAERDAENRAARELAQLLELSIAQDLARR